MNPLNEIEFALLRDFLQQETGIAVPDSKQYLFSTRLAGILEKEQCRSFSELFLRLRSGDSALTREVVEAMTTHESGFFREPHHFETLCGKILPTLVERKLQALPGLAPTVRILSAGCSFGQEPYTVALCIEAWRERQTFPSLVEVSIVGVDLSSLALERARRGVYTELELGPNLPAAVRERYFRKDGSGWEIDASIRERVEFRSGNLSKSLVELGIFDVILCRNVIIYFSPEEKVALLGRLRDRLEPGGALFIGSTENLYGIEVGLVPCTHGQSTHYESRGPSAPFEAIL